MRRALTTVALAGAVALVPLSTTAAFADTSASGVAVLSAPTDQDEPLETDGDDDTGKYGLIGLTGLLGLFGYKKYKDSRHDAGTGGSSRKV